ncbi:DNA topoisomerase IB [Pseudotabrizicola alkalilacus]|uniref:DNA topoisomerase n=1 Tax=Pseudotabrizicola alkalilacus TaxID=2305252 RepID=A0A411YYH1_9RHOB|nr:DNA topoisomerase IB [Pseudotabrizicola alkalilacus]RGP35954.1 DNA topoisomerase IB [Pseudotabrizicola alkalilacus]
MANSLVYVSDQDPGIRRKRAGRGFSYVGPDGRCLTGAARRRVEKLGVPPAYSDVWICLTEDGHLQATGRDARGRKQYRYHPDWQSAQASTKYAGLITFAMALPALRARLTRDLRHAPGGRDFTVAALVLLLDRSFLRIGNPEYAVQNASFGATTLLRRHVRIGKDRVHLDFTAKGGKRLRQVLRDQKLHRVLQTVGDLPGRQLFTYVDADGAPRPVTSGEVNDWLATVMGEGVTAKAFRTWGGTLAAYTYAETLPPETRLTVKAMAQAASDVLHNTPAICRSSYVHPAVLELAALEPAERQRTLATVLPTGLRGLRADEQRLLSFLQSTEKNR